MKNLPVAIPETAQGRIITSVGGLYTVETFSGICTCKARGIFRKRGITPYVGDYVQLSEDGVIQEILPRKNSILRPPVSNLDQIFFVVSTCHPAPNLLLLDSFLTVAIYQDIQPAVVLTKMDLAQRRTAGKAVHRCPAFRCIRWNTTSRKRSPPCQNSLPEKSA